MSELRVTVVVPAYREARLLATTLKQIPAAVSEVIVVDDGSPDRTAEVATAISDERVRLIRHGVNRGVGAAIYTGYQEALRGQSDVFVVMAGDNQMHPSDLPQLLEPLALGHADYVKGNRLIHPEYFRMPRARRYGSRTLAWFTSWVSGKTLGDTQCGYTAITREAAQRILWEEMWQRYGYPNDLLIHLLRRGMRVQEAPVRPVYATEVSGLRPWHFFSILFVIARRAWLEFRLKRISRIEMLRGRSPQRGEASAG